MERTQNADFVYVKFIKHNLRISHHRHVSDY
jgi:hypothetical protein